MAVAAQNQRQRREKTGFSGGAGAEDAVVGYWRFEEGDAGTSSSIADLSEPAHTATGADASPCQSEARCCASSSVLATTKFECAPPQCAV